MLAKRGHLQQIVKEKHSETLAGMAGVDQRPAFAHANARRTVLRCTQQCRANTETRTDQKSAGTERLKDKGTARLNTEAVRLNTKAARLKHRGRETRPQRQRDSSRQRDSNTEAENSSRHIHANQGAGMMKPSRQ